FWSLKTYQWHLGESELLLEAFHVILRYISEKTQRTSMEFMDYTSSDEENTYEFNPNDNYHEVPIENWYQEEVDYGETWRDDAYSDSDLSEDHAPEEMEPKPPDHCHMGHTTRLSSSQPWIEYNDNFYNCGSRSIYFSGKGNYLHWEEDLEDYFWDYNIPERDKPSYAIGTLTGEAYVVSITKIQHALGKTLNGLSTTPLARKASNPTHLLKPQATPQGKCSGLNKLFKLTCYRCKAQGHVAKFCPTRRATTKTESEQQNVSHDPQIIKSPQTGFPSIHTEIGQSDYLDSKTVLMHLPLSKSVEQNADQGQNMKQNKVIMCYPNAEKDEDDISFNLIQEEPPDYTLN
ncbi:hypothetical protein EUTSA_v10019470mg, partial [Eutrema salsugineum]